jgi:hypothetical protein
MNRNGYNPAIVAAYYRQQGLPEPVFEYRFHSVRGWLIDIAWPGYRLALEAQGGVFIAGRHNRGAALLDEWEKLNALAGLGWRVLFFQPKDVCLLDTVATIKLALSWKCSMEY